VKGTALRSAGQNSVEKEKTVKAIITVTTALVILGLAFSNAVAGGIYVGAGIGNTYFSSEVEDALDQIQSIDENSTAWKIFGGFNPAKFIGIEGGYRDFGQVSSTVSSELFETKTSGWDIEALGLLRISIVDIFAKAGIMWWSQDVTLLGYKFDESGTDFLWGLGGGVHLGPVGIRVEWESVVIEDPDNVSMVSLSGTFGF
jgi:OOP family OmpA-OmpF porin